VPDENIGKNLEELCIRCSNLKYLDAEIVDANLKTAIRKDLIQYFYYQFLRTFATTRVMSSSDLSPLVC
jgi:hypothetical protein